MTFKDFLLVIFGVFELGASRQFGSRKLHRKITIDDMYTFLLIMHCQKADMYTFLLIMHCQKAVKL